MISLKPGERLSSAVCTAEFAVVRAPDGEVDLRCGGAPVRRQDEQPGEATPDPGLMGAGVQLGKRYSDDESGLELLCVKPGDGALTVDGRPMGIMGPKALPASD